MIGFNPIVSYAVENLDLSSYVFDINDLPTGNNINIVYMYDNDSYTRLVGKNYNFSGGSPTNTTVSPFNFYRCAFYFDESTGYYNFVYKNTETSGIQIYNSFAYSYAWNKNKSTGVISNDWAYQINMANTSLYTTSRGGGLYATNVPLFKDQSSAYNYLNTGSIDENDLLNSNLAYQGNSTVPVGVLKNVKYTLNYTTGSKGKYESVSWGRYSTTGHDLEDGNTLVEFALQDRSTINRGSAYAFPGTDINQGIRENNTDGTVSLKTNEEIMRDIQEGTADGSYQLWQGNPVPFIQRLAGVFAEHVWPYGSTNKAIAQGLINTAPSYNKMISLGTVNGMQRRFAFNGLQAYTTSSNFAQEAPEIHSSLTGVYNTNLPNFLKGGFIESVISNSNYYNIADYNLSYNIYARIVKGSTKGVWLLIDKHGNAIGPADPRPRGGITKRPVILPNDYEPTNDFTDAPEPEPAPPADDNDDGLDDNEDNDPLGVEETIDDLENPTGNGTTNIYNNYTYNYDNRSWIENHYTNEDVDEVNEGIEWLKLFPNFFGLFQKLFGAFLPGWASVVVTLAIPIVVGLLVFKIIKGVIPFV